VIEYLLHVVPVHRLEVLGLKTNLVAGSDPVPFGVAGYDAEDNEFDTLDGLQLSWYIGSSREIAIFEQHRQVGPITKLVPLKAGNGAVLVVLTDPNYESLDPAVMEFTITAPLQVEPDGVFLLEGATVQFRLFEKVVDRDGKSSMAELNLTKSEKEDQGEAAPEYKFEVKEAEFASFDEKTGFVTALKEGETTLFVRNAEGEVVKSVPVRITTASSITVTTLQDPESNQMILGNEYDVAVNIFNRDGRKIHPSENILCKTTFPKQLDVIKVSESGLSAKVKAVNVGLGKLKASLRSVLTSDDEEIEVVPHVKGGADFEIYETIVISPKETILPWDEETKPSYELKYQATGGGKVYNYTTDNEEMGTVTSEGVVTTNGGPGAFTVRVSMVRGKLNFDEAKVYIQPATHLELKQSYVETSTDTPITMALNLKTFLPEGQDPVMFTDCADVPFKIVLSDNQNFEVGSVFARGNNRVYGACASFTVKAKTPGTTTKVSITYKEPSTGRVLKDATHISAYRSLHMVYPTEERSVQHNGRAGVLLPVGSATTVVMRGGPTPWMSKPSAHFKQVEVDEPEVARVTRIPDEEISAPVVSGGYSDVHAYRVTCLKVGETSFTFTVGNTASDSNKHPVSSTREVFVKCDVPAKVVVKVEPRKVAEDSAKYVANPKTSRIMVHNHRDVLLYLTAKNSGGETFHDISSLKFDFEISEESSLKKTHAKVTLPQEPIGPDFGKLVLPGKAFQSLSPDPTKFGDVDVKVTLTGYDEDVLKAAKASTPPPIPRVVEDDEDDDDDEEFTQHHHSLRETVELELARQADINAAIRSAAKSH
jgi:hypothetical protein